MDDNNNNAIQDSSINQNAAQATPAAPVSPQPAVQPQATQPAAPNQSVIYQQPGVQPGYYARPVSPVPYGYGVYAHPVQPVQPVQPMSFSRSRQCSRFSRFRLIRQDPCSALYPALFPSLQQNPLTRQPGTQAEAKNAASLCRSSFRSHWPSPCIFRWHSPFMW